MEVHDGGVRGVSNPCELTVVFTYYNQPQMLKAQEEAWRTYESLPVRVLLVDDASTVPADTFVETYRVQDDQPWHQDGARNLGVHMARSPWVLLMDLDHILSRDALIQVLAAIPYCRPKTAYKLKRKERVSGKSLSAAANIWLIRPDEFWEVGGYDERLCGAYGSDREFRPRLQSKLRESVFPIELEVALPADVPDAATQGLDRTVVPIPKLDGPPHVLQFRWEKVR